MVAQAQAHAMRRNYDLLPLEADWVTDFDVPDRKHTQMTTARYRSLRESRRTTLKYTYERRRQDPSMEELPVLVGPVPSSQAVSEVVSTPLASFLPRSSFSPCPVPVQCLRARDCMSMSM
jgi:hypothetical protein